MAFRVADADRQDEDIPPDYDTTAEAISDLDKELGDAFSNSKKWLIPNRVQEATPLTWDGGVTSAMAFIDHLQNVIETVTSIPGLFKGLTEGGVASGVALSRLYLRLRASAMHTKNATEVAVNELLALSNVCLLYTSPSPRDS